MSSLVFAALICTTTPSSASESGGDNKEELDLYTIKKLIFSDDSKENIVSYNLIRSRGAGSPATGLTLLSRPMSIVSGVCRRDTYIVRLPLGRGKNPAIIESPITKWTGLTLANSCDELDNNVKFAQIQPQVADPVEAAQNLVWLKTAVTAAKRSGKLGFSLKCVEEINRSGCAERPRVALSNLPLENLFVITKAGPTMWRYVFSASPRKGGPVWVASVEGINSTQTKILITKELPSPF